MSDDNLTSNGLAVVVEIIRTAGENPQIKEAGHNLGNAALTITKTINNALLPLAAVNFAFDKARIYFNEKFSEDLSKKAESIPLENLIEPKASIAGPTLQGLAFTYEEPQLKNMYLSLLATSMDSRIASRAHPAFVEIIKQLSSDEAHLLKTILSTGNSSAIAEVRLDTEEKFGWNLIRSHLCDLTNTSNNEPVEIPKLPSMIDNWVRLGLINVSYSTNFTSPGSYDWVERRPEFIRYKQLHETDTRKLSYSKGIMTRTALGAEFAAAVGLATNLEKKEK